MCAGDTAAQQACAELSASKQIPHAITLALRHLISPILSIPQHKAPRFEPQAVTESSSVDQQQPQATSPGQQATVTEAASLAHVQNTTVINMMMHAAVRPLTAHVPISPAGTSNGSVHSMSSNPEAKAVSDFAAHGAAQMVEADHWAIAFAGNVLTVTGSVTHLSSTNRSQLTGLTPALRVLRALKQLAEATTGSRQTSGCASRTTAARTASNATGMGISVSDHSNVSVKQPTILLCAGLKGPVDAVLALGNVTQLLTGAASSTTEVSL